MTKERITIGQFCKDTGITPSKLRYYESLGLIEPAEIDPNNSYHYYSDRQYVEIEMIQIYRKLNFPIKQIQKILEKKDAEELFHLIAKQKFQARKQILQQQEILNNLSWLYDTWEQNLKLHNQRNLKMKLNVHPERQVLMTKLSGKNKLLSIKEQSALLHRTLSQKTVSELSAVNSIERVYGFQLDRNSFLENTFSLSGKFLELPQYNMNIETKLQNIPAGTYLSFYVQAFTDDSWISQVLAYVNENQLHIQKIYLNEVVLPLLPRKDAYFLGEILVK